MEYLKKIFTQFVILSRAILGYLLKPGFYTREKLHFFASVSQIYLYSAYTM